MPHLSRASPWVLPHFFVRHVHQMFNKSFQLFSIVYDTFGQKLHNRNNPSDRHPKALRISVLCTKILLKAKETTSYPSVTCNVTSRMPKMMTKTEIIYYLSKPNRPGRSSVCDLPVLSPTRSDVSTLPRTINKKCGCMVCNRAMYSDKTRHACLFDRGVCGRGRCHMTDQTHRLD